MDFSQVMRTGHFAGFQSFERTTSGIMIGIMVSLMGSNRTQAATTSPTAALTCSPFSSFQNWKAYAIDLSRISVMINFTSTCSSKRKGRLNRQEVLTRGQPNRPFSSSMYTERPRLRRNSCSQISIHTCRSWWNAWCRPSQSRWIRRVGWWKIR